jgi:CPA2 family monovalent cation:H+ antiporter-2
VQDVLFIRDLAVVLTVAALVAWACRRLHVSTVVGYLAAGIIIEPYTPPLTLVSDLNRVHTLVQLGLVFLIFSVGLGFSFGRKQRLGLPVLLATVIGAVLVLNFARLLGAALGWTPQQGLFLAGMLMVSSSAIIAKVLDELGATHERAGQLALGITVLEDVVAVVMLTVLSSLVELGSRHPVVLTPGDNDWTDAHRVSARPVDPL